MSSARLVLVGFAIPGIELVFKVSRKISRQHAGRTDANPISIFHQALAILVSAHPPV
jgi:hypothetical protein